MNLKEQQYVCVLAKHQNITRAAAELYISQPALSIYISNLENSMGVKLFERIGKRFLLTYAGERYVEAGEKMLALRDQFDQELQEITGDYRGRIRLGVQIRRVPWFLPPVIAAFEREYPHMEVDIEDAVMDELNEKRENFQLDYLICSKAAAEAKSSVVYPLFTELILVAVPACHKINEKAEYVPGKRYRNLDLSYLNGETLLVPRKDQSLRKDVDTLLREKHVKPGKIREVGNIEASVQMAGEGMGIAFNREGYALNMRYSKPVNYYAIPSGLGAIDYVLAHRKGKCPGSADKRLIEMLAERGRTFYQ